MQFGTHFHRDFPRRINILGAPDAGGPVRCNFTYQEFAQNRGEPREIIIGEIDENEAINLLNASGAAREADARHIT